MKEEFNFFEVEYLRKLRQYFLNLPKIAMKSHDKRSCHKVSKILAKLKKVFNFKKYLIYVFIEI